MMEAAVETRAAPRARFSVNDLAPGERYEVWHDSISCIFQTDRSRTMAQTSEFRASLEAGLPGEMMVAETATSAQNWRRDGALIARDGMDHYMLQIYLSGTQCCAADGEDVQMPRGGVVVYDLSREMRATTTDLRNLSLVLPRATLEGLLRDPDDHHMRLLEPGAPLTALLIEHMMTLRRHLGRLPRSSGGAVTGATAQLVAATLNEAETPASAERRNDYAQRTLIRRDIEARLADPSLTPESLRARHGVSRNRLYALFAASGGVAAHIRERRLKAAMALLVDPVERAAPVREIAARCGFSSASDFSRAFQRRFGLSPRAARHYGAPGPSTAAQAGVDRSYETWLRTLGL